jgi:hypothetical protein
VEYIKRVESVFEVIAEPNRRAILMRGVGVRAYLAVAVIRGIVAGMARTSSWNPVNLPTVLVLGCFLGCFLTAFGSRALADDNAMNPGATYTATTQGSALTHGSMVDADSGVVIILSAGPSRSELSQSLFNTSVRVSRLSSIRFHGQSRSL